MTRVAPLTSCIFFGCLPKRVRSLAPCMRSAWGCTGPPHRCVKDGDQLQGRTLLGAVLRLIRAYGMGERADVRGESLTQTRSR